MRATERLLVATHEACLEHSPFPGHPDRPQRINAALDGAAAAGAGRLAVEVMEGAVLAGVGRVHDAGLAHRLREACRTAPGIFDCPDNPISSGTYRAALAAAACSLTAAEAAVAGRAENVFVAVRPPGHHALRDRAMGFCFFNNAAIAAEHLLEHGRGPVAIVDFDVHHGNGTQEHFWFRDDVFYLSVHRYPFYPGSGSADQVGSGRGRGFTRNFPLATGANDETYEAAVAAGLDEILAVMAPGAWVVSAGFDAHNDDPLGGMRVSGEGFAAIGAMLAQAKGANPLVAALEGGYNLDVLRLSVGEFLRGLAWAGKT